jgi:hypothetical protein
VGDGAEAIPGLKTESSNCLPPLLERIFISLSPLNSDTSRRHPVSKNQQSRHEKNQPPPDTFSVSPVSKGINQNEERPTMDINDLFDGIMKSINQFADEIAEQRLQEKMQDTG